MADEKVRLTTAELRDHLNHHVDRLVHACEQFDGGHARAILGAATPIAILACEGALIRTVGGRKLTFFGTPMPHQNGAKARAPFYGLCELAGSGATGSPSPAPWLGYKPLYNGGSLYPEEHPLLEFRALSRDEWMAETVLVWGDADVRISRNELIRAIRNQIDSHGDKDLDAKVAAVLRQENFRPSFAIAGRETSPEVGAQLATLRQIAYEFQKTLAADCSDLCERSPMTTPPPRDWLPNRDVQVLRDRGYMEEVLADAEREDPDSVFTDEIKRQIAWET